MIIYKNNGYVVAVCLLLLLSCNSKQENDEDTTESKIESDTVAEGSTVVENVQGWTNSTVRKLSINGYSPIFLGDTAVIYTTNNFKGLWMCPLEGDQPTKLTDADGAGYQPVIFKDSVYFQDKGSRDLKRVSLASGEVAKTNQAYQTPTVYFRKRINPPYAYVAGDLLSIKIVDNNGKERSIAPHGKKNYLNASVSPDGRQLLYEVSGGEAHIADLNGNVIDSLGAIDAPQWINNEEIIYTKKSDDGMQTLSSSVYIKEVQTGKEYKVSGEYQLENPSVNRKGARILANSLDGDLFIITQ